MKTSPEMLPGLMSNEAGCLFVVAVLVVIGLLIQLAFTLSVIQQGLNEPY